MPPQYSANTLNNYIRKSVACNKGPSLWAPQRKPTGTIPYYTHLTLTLYCYRFHFKHSLMFKRYACIIACTTWGGGFHLDTMQLEYNTEHFPLYFQSYAARSTLQRGGGTFIQIMFGYAYKACMYRKNTGRNTEILVPQLSKVFFAC